MTDENIGGNGSGATANGTGSNTEAADLEKKRIADDDKARAGLTKTIEELRKDITDLREERRMEREAKEKDKSTSSATTVVATEDELGTAEGWKKHISKTAEDSLKPVLTELEALKSTHRKRAERTFLEKHPEYKDEAKMALLRDRYSKVKSRTDHDSEDILEDLEDAWAIENRATLLEKERVAKLNQTERELELADIASSGSSDSHDKNTVEDFGLSSKDKLEARRQGKSYKDYATLLKQLEEASL